MPDQITQLTRLGQLRATLTVNVDDVDHRQPAVSVQAFPPTFSVQILIGQLAKSLQETVALPVSTATKTSWI